MKKIILFASILALASCTAVEADFADGWTLYSKGDTKTVYQATVPSTVLGVLTDNGLYADAFVDDNYKTVIDKSIFDTSWVYTKNFAFDKIPAGKHAFLELDGVNYTYKVTLNGKELSPEGGFVGPYLQHRIDVTDCLKRNNKLEIEVFRAREGDLNMGFVDWNPRPADENMGIFRPVRIDVDGAVSLSAPFVKPKVNTETLAEAFLTVGATLTNNSSKEVSGELKLELEGNEASIPVALQAGESRIVSLSPEDVEFLHMTNPRLWWCYSMGSPELYNLHMEFVTDGAASDAKDVEFGVREVGDFWIEGGHRGFTLNGKKVLLRGGGWTDDIFLRNPAERNAVELAYVKDMNLNCIRLEGFWGESEDIYNQCDRMGILIIVGWSCFWEWDSHIGTPADEFGCISSEEDMALTCKSLEHQVTWLRNHPSIVAWYVGSDKLPRPELEEMYLAMLKDVDDRPYVNSAQYKKSAVSGLSGMKMYGPYDYIAPSYWYSPEAEGGAYGFNTETGIGAQLPMRESIDKMFSEENLWPLTDIWNFHCATGSFGTVKLIKEAVEQRFGGAKDLDDFLMKAHQVDYEGVKAMFEAFRASGPRGTGIIQWMLNSAWPSVYWQLYDWYLNPTAGYYGTKSAGMPVQLVYDYYRHCAVAVADEGSKGDFQAEAAVYSPEGKLIFSASKDVTLAPGDALKAIDIPSGNNGFLFFTLKQDGKVVARNSYILSAREDVSNWKRSNWFRTPLAQHADYSWLDSLADADVAATVTKNSDSAFVVELENKSDVPAYFIRLIVKNAEGEVILPAFWEDNFLTLEPGAKRSIALDIPAGAADAAFSMEGWNVATAQIQ